VPVVDVEVRAVHSQLHANEYQGAGID
jgi:hypothetical protein